MKTINDKQYYIKSEVGKLISIKGTITKHIGEPDLYLNQDSSISSSPTVRRFYLRSRVEEYINQNLESINRRKLFKQEEQEKEKKIQKLKQEQRIELIKKHNNKLEQKYLFLWEEFVQKHENIELAIVDAIYILNKYVRTNQNVKEIIYPIKNYWIEKNQKHLEYGKFVREEYYNNLYEHHFNIFDKKYCFHAYIKPKIITKELGEDSSIYGKPYNANEIQDIKKYINTLLFFVSKQFNFLNNKYFSPIIAEKHTII